MKIKCFILTLACTLTVTISFSQECLKGECKDGIGVIVKPGRGYYIGQFDKKGNFHGKGMEVYFNNNDSRPGDFLFSLAKGIPDFEKIKTFKPSRIYVGEFENDLFKSGGILYDFKKYEGRIRYTEEEMIKGLSQNWFGRFTDEWLAYGYDSYTYTGDFSPSQDIKGKGVISFYKDADTVNYVSDDFGNDKKEVVVEVKRKNWPANGIYLGRLMMGRPVEWGLSNINWGKTAGSYELLKHNEVVRQLFCYGTVIEQGKTGVYPYDTMFTQRMQANDSMLIEGPVSNGKVNGFGKIVYTETKQKQKIGTYTGYIKNNQPNGYGILLLAGKKDRYGLFKEGELMSGTAVSQDIVNRVYLTTCTYNDLKEGYLTVQNYDNLNVLLSRGKPTSGSWGYYIEDKGWHGKCVFYDRIKTESRYYENGKMISSNTQEMVALVNTVLTKDGVASYVKSSSWNGSFHTADGRSGNIRNNERKNSSHTIKEFYGFCPDCNGSGIVVESGTVAGSTTTSTRTEQYTQGAVVGYWQGTRKVTTSTYTPGYNFTTSYRCTNQNYEYMYFPKGSSDSETWHAKIRITSIRE